MSQAISEKMRAGLAASVFPGAVLLVALRKEVVFHEAFGFAQLKARPLKMNCETCFDLASLTKAIATTTAIALLEQEGLICLKDALSKYLPSFSEGNKSEVRLFHLLNHASGLPAWRPYYEAVIKRDTLEEGFLGSAQAKAMIYEMAHEEGLIFRPGQQSLYSDIGFILLSELIEQVSGMRLDQFCAKYFFSRLGTEVPFFRPAGAAPAGETSFAATETVDWRGGLICGTVHDDNAYVMGGVSGHAGLFSTAFRLFQAVLAWVESIHGGGFLKSELAAKYVQRQVGGESPKGSSWGLGWDTPSSPSSSGHYFSPHSFGHLGFTGTSIWVDLEKDLIVLLLTNRVHPSRKNEQIRAFRPELHDLIVQEFVGGP